MKLIHHERIVGTGAIPARWFVVLHGLFGSGRNWASIARRTVQAAPDWGALLVDLREHGRSLGFQPPHTVASAAEDVARLIQSLGLETPLAVGHSFGGKVAMQWALGSHAPPGRLVVVDSTPASTTAVGDASRVLSLLRRLPAGFESRGRAVEMMMRAGESSMLAQWMATSLVERDGVWAWAMNLDAIGQMLLDFQSREYWGLIESGRARVEFVRATRAHVLSSQACDRIQSAGPQVTLSELEGGHWLHVDNPVGVVEIILRQLRDSSV